MKQHKRIFIIGHSGAGKGFLAQAVAKKLGWQYLDADFALASSIGRPASEICGKTNSVNNDSKNKNVFMNRNLRGYRSGDFYWGRNSIP